MKKSGDKQLREVELRGLHRLTAGQVSHRSPAWSPGGRWLCLEVGEAGESCWLICDSKGRAARVLEGPAEGSASFAPDGTIAYGRRVGAAVEIWQLASGDHAPRQLLGGDGRLYRDPAFSPDGRHLCYAADERSDDGGALRLWLLDLASGQATPLGATPEGLRPHRPAWAPDGARLYFEALSEDGGAAIYALDPQTQALSIITAAGEGCRRPAPLGADLLVAERDLGDGGSELLLIDHAGEGEPRQRRLTEPERCAREPAIVREGGDVWIAFAMLGRGDDGEPLRHDVYHARLTGLRRRLPRLAAPETEGGER